MRSATPEATYYLIGKMWKRSCGRVTYFLDAYDVSIYMLGKTYSDYIIVKEDDKGCRIWQDPSLKFDGNITKFEKLLREL